MSKFALHFYKTGFHKDEHGYYDNLKTYLRSLSSVWNVSDFQYLTLDTTAIKIDMPQSQFDGGYVVNLGDYIMAVNTSTGAIYYYYITSVAWKAQQTAEIGVELDYLNTFNDWLSYVSNRSHITRCFKDRYVKLTTTATTAMPVIDKMDENFNPPLVKTDSKTIADALSSFQEKTYLIYKTDYDTSDEDLAKQPLSTYMLFENKHYVESAKMANTFKPSDFGILDLISLTPDTKNVTFHFLNGTTMAQDINSYYLLKYVPNDKCWYVYIAGSTTTNYQKAFIGVTAITIGLSYPADRYVGFANVTENTILSQTYAQIKAAASKVETFYSDVVVDTIPAFADWYAENKTNSLISKIIEVPYPPVAVQNASDESLKIPTGWSLTADGLKLDNQLQSWNRLLTKLQTPVKALVLSSISADDAYDLTKETKMYNSAFYSWKFVYDSQVYQVQLENMTTWNPLNAVSINYVLGKEVTSELAFHIAASVTATSDFEGWMISSRDLEIPVYTNSYLQYMRYGNQYDETDAATSLWKSIGNAALTVGGSTVAGFLKGNVGGAIGGLATGVVSSAINIHTSAISNRNAINAKIANYQSQASTMNTANAMSIFDAYGGNKLMVMTYQPPTELKNSIADYFRQFGYAADQYAVPTATRYWNDYFQVDIVWSTGTVINRQIAANIKNICSQGFRWYHYHNGGYDLDLEKENYETSFLQ